MRTTLALLIVVLAAPSPADAWGFEAHRFIVERAIELLPPAMRSYYQAHRRFITEHTIDPDLWRLAGFEEESPRHFINLDAIGEYPFRNVPRDYDVLVRRFGADRMREYGLLPWRAQEVQGWLRRAFEDHRKGSRRALENAQFFSAVVAHYVADAHVPFHAVLNYDGQLTGQQGIHSRFESELFTRFRSELRVVPAPAAPAGDVRELAFDVLIESFADAAPVLKLDLEARRGSSDYDRAYYRRFFNAVRPVLERRLSRAVTAVASVWVGAWQAAGSPAISATR